MAIARHPPYAFQSCCRLPLSITPIVAAVPGLLLAARLVAPAQLLLKLAAKRRWVILGRFDASGLVVCMIAGRVRRVPSNGARRRGYRPEVAVTLNSLGLLYRRAGRFEAEEASSEALAIYRTFAVRDPGAYRSDVAMILMNMGTSTAAPDIWARRRRP
jgi:hypothetical protein